MTYVENDLDDLKLLDYLSFDDENEEFISFYPYRQIYGEVSGYINNDLYIKVGLDIYNEVIKHKEQNIFNYSENELNTALMFFMMRQKVLLIVLGKLLMMHVRAPLIFLVFVLILMGIIFQIQLMMHLNTQMRNF